MLRWLLVKLGHALAGAGWAVPYVASGTKLRIRPGTPDSFRAAYGDCSVPPLDAVGWADCSGDYIYVLTEPGGSGHWGRTYRDSALLLCDWEPV